MSGNFYLIIFALIFVFSIFMTKKKPKKNKGEMKAPEKKNPVRNKTTLK